MSTGFLIAYSLKAALNTFALGNFISFFSTTFLMSLLALNSTCSGTCSSSDPSMLTRSSSRAGSAYSGSAWTALLDFGAVWGALLDFGAVWGALLDFGAVWGALLDSGVVLGVEPCGAEF